MEQCLAEFVACGEVVFIEKMGPKRKSELVEEKSGSDERLILAKSNYR